MFFLYHKTTRPTGRVLAKAIGFQHFGLSVRGRPDFVLRWGNAVPLEYALSEDRVLNTPRAIMRASDKLAAFQAMKEAGVNVPRFTTSQTEAVDWRQAGTTIIGRTRKGSKGRGIVVYSPDVERYTDYHELYTELIPNRREYRLHVVGDSVVRIQRKYPHGDTRPDAFIKNHEGGFVFKSPARGLLPDRERSATSAVSALGLDFGAVDLVVTADGTAYVLEVNTAPACSPLTGRAYVSALCSLIERRSDGEYAPPGNFNELASLGAANETPDIRNAILQGG